MISRMVLPSALRRATYLRVRSSVLVRVNTMRHRAWLAWRFPPRLSRWWMVLPDDASIGAEVRERGFAFQPLRVVTGGDDQDGGGGSVARAWSHTRRDRCPTVGAPPRPMPVVDGTRRGGVLAAHPVR